MILDDLLYTRDHEWLRVNGDTGRVGVTHYAQEAMGSVVFVELPEAGSAVSAGEPFGVVESVKAASDLYSPASGKVLAVNEELLERPELINEDPYNRGWLIEIQLDETSVQDSLLKPEEYREMLEAND